jgi:SAM-dependent methyltransferase
MGLGLHAVEAIVREHAFKPVHGDVLLIGRQTVYYSPDEIVHLLSNFGVDTSGIDLDTIELDQNTVDWKVGFEGKKLITDRALFRLLGARNIQAIDHSAYENAEVIHDLRYPLPAHLHGIADFLVDGSTLDNVFTPSTTLQNYSRLLKPGGRLVAINAFSPYDTAYAIMPPLWYLDYFVMNKFTDARIYVLVYGDNKDNVFYVDLDFLRQAERGMGRFISPFHMVTVVFAEKGTDSTSDRMPNQQDYRSEEDWEIYRRHLATMLESQRPHLARSHASQFLMEVASGHRFINNQFIAE